MPTLACPTCGLPTPRSLDHVNHHADVNYYRCDSCASVWHVPKSNPLGPVEIVAVGRPPAQPTTTPETR